MLNTIKQDLLNFKTLSPQVKFLLLFQLVVLFGVSLLLGFIFSPERGANIVVKPRLKEPVQASLLSGTNLAINPDEKVLKLGEKQIFSLELSGQSVVAADIVLKYDPNVIAISELTPGIVFDKIMVSDVKNGQVYYSAHFSPENQSTNHQGVIFTFTTKALKKSSETKIMIDRQQTFTSKSGDNTLKTTQDAIIRIYD